MQLIYTDSHFTISGQSYPNIPILIDKNCEIVRPVYQFIIYLVIQDSRIQSLRTVKSYATSLLDYFSFLTANNIDWNEPYLNDTDNFSLSALALYRNWSRSLVKKNGKRWVSDSSINLRLSALKRFYNYCYKNGLINFEPWETLYKVVPESMPSFLGHTHGQSQIKSNDLVLKTFKKLPKLLSLKQCRELISAIDSTTFKLITKLILSTGLRKDEVISFVSEHIYEPDLTNLNKRILIDLEPTLNGQRTKGSKPRRIYLSVMLMKELWDYINFGERVIRARKYKAKYDNESPFVFLNRFGSPLSETALNSAYAKLNKKNGGILNFKVHPHMLRHTYATIELFAESKRIGTTKALAWVKDRMGHSSISTTSIYLHCIESLEAKELSTYQIELDEME